MERAVFLDRDGTINEEVGYLRSLDMLKIIPGAGAAIRRLNDAGFKVVINIHGEIVSIEQPSAPAEGGDDGGDGG